MSQVIDQDVFFETNAHGRLLGANRRFCRMFGVRPDEVLWHYILDFHRREEDWLRFRDAMETHGQINAYMVRMRHRKGRSFQCLLQSSRVLGEDGTVRYQTLVQKVCSTMNFVRTIPSEIQASSDTVVYLTVCNACGKVKDGQGSWLSPVRAVKPAAHRKACYCPECSAQLYPGLLDPQNWEQATAAMH